MKVMAKLLYTFVRLMIFAVAVIGVLIVARLVFLFFGFLKTVPGYDFVVKVTSPMLSSLKISEVIKTPYDGEFDLTAVAFLLLLLTAEFFLGVIRGALARFAAEKTTPGEEKQQKEKKTTPSKVGDQP